MSFRPLPVISIATVSRAEIIPCAAAFLTPATPATPATAEEPAVREPSVAHEAAQAAPSLAAAAPPSAPRPAAPRPAAARPAPQVVDKTDELDLNAVVLPVLARQYGPTILAMLVTAVITWIIARRRR